MSEVHGIQDHTVSQGILGDECWGELQTGEVFPFTCVPLLCYTSLRATAARPKLGTGEALEVWHQLTELWLWYHQDLALTYTSRCYIVVRAIPCELYQAPPLAPTSLCAVILPKPFLNCLVGTYTGCLQGFKIFCCKLHLNVANVMGALHFQAPKFIHSPASCNGLCRCLSHATQLCLRAGLHARTASCHRPVLRE